MESAQCSSYHDGAGGHDDDDDGRGGHDGHDDDGGTGGYNASYEFNREKNLLTLQSFIMKMLVTKLTKPGKAFKKKRS